MEETNVQDVSIVDDFIKNINSKEYKDYLYDFKKFHEEKNKCMKSKKCKYHFEIGKNEISKTKISSGEKSIIRIPEYLDVRQRLKDIKKEMIDCDKNIRFMQNNISSDSDKKYINQYKELRNKFIELEKEEESLNDYFLKVNNYEPRMNKIISLKNNIINKNMEKKNIYYEILFMSYKKTDDDFDNDEYETKIREYLSLNDIEKLEKELKEIQGYNLISDQFYSSEKRNESLGKIDYVIKNQQKKKKKIIKKKKKE